MKVIDSDVWPGKLFENQEIGDVENGHSVYFMLVRKNGNIIFDGQLIWEPDRSAPFEAYAEVDI